MPRKYRNPRSRSSDQGRVGGTGQPSRRDARNMQTADCPARGRHEADCICKGTGKVKVQR